VRVIERITPVAAVAAAFTTLACCLPLSFLGAGIAGAIAWTGAYRDWVLGLAAALLIPGLVGIFRGRNECRTGRGLSVGLFWACVVIVLVIVFFPQVIASLLAG